MVDIRIVYSTRVHVDPVWPCIPFIETLRQDLKGFDEFQQSQPPQQYEGRLTDGEKLGARAEKFF